MSLADPMAIRIRRKMNPSQSRFDVEEAKKTGGLGLHSMQERIHLVHGSLSVESKPGHGTKVIVWAPVIARSPEICAGAGDGSETTATRYSIRYTDAGGASH